MQPRVDAAPASFQTSKGHYFLWPLLLKKVVGCTLPALWATQWPHWGSARKGWDFWYVRFLRYTGYIYSL